jgi:pimeloyl-ACP methyl ester carboxylesterase
LLTRVVDNDNLLPTIAKPVLITHGALDAIVRQEAVAQHRARLPQAQVHIMPDAGHAAFWDDAASFNRRLGAFRDEVVRSGESYVAAGGAA